MLHRLRLRRISSSDSDVHNLMRQSPVALPAAYAFAHYGKSLFWDMVELLFAFYLAEIYGIDPAIMGVLLFVFLLWDAVTDPLLGVILSSNLSSDRSLVYLQLVGAVVSAISFCGVFFKPDIGADGLIVYAVCIGLLFRTAYTIYDVPQNTLLNRLSHTDDRRVTIAALRVAGSALATISVGLATAIILSANEHSAETQNYLLVAALFSSVALISSLTLLYAGRKSSRARLLVAKGIRAKLSSTLLRTDLVVLFAGVFVLSIGWPTFGKFLPFFASYVMGDHRLAGILLLTTAIGSLLSQPLWVWLGVSVSRKKLILFILALVLLTCTAFFTFSRLGTGAAIVLTALMASSSGAVNMLIWTRLADRLFEAREAGVSDVLAFGIFTFASKLGLGVGGLVLGSTLSVGGYQQRVELPETGQTIVVAAMAFAPAIVTVIATALMIFESGWRTIQEESAPN